MKKHVPIIVLTLVCVILSLMLFKANREIRTLKENVHTQHATTANHTLPVVAENETSTVQPLEKTAEFQSLETTAPVEETSGKEEPAQRVMKGMAEMMENPTMNKVMEATQRGAVGALYSDFIEYLGLSTEETNYFMDILMYRQMKQVDLSMKMMSGTLTPEEKEQMMAELKKAQKLTHQEMKDFLNNEDDFEEYTFYEKTMGERMMLSSMDQKLGGSEMGLSNDTYRNLLDMMHSEKKNYNFTSDLHDEENTDLSPSRFSKQNVENFGNDMDQLYSGIFTQAETMLTPEQFVAFKEAVTSTLNMQQAQLELAAQMFGGGK